jgi:pyridoxamine 5'-phosphate oxidase family protein
MLSDAEVSYLKTQRLARIASASAKGVPEVSPVGFEFDGEYFWVGSHSQEIFVGTRRYKNITEGNNRISLVVDDLLSVDPWRPRAIKVSGTAEVMDHDGIFGSGKYIRITPEVTASWGIEPSQDWKPTVRHRSHSRSS